MAPPRSRLRKQQRKKMDRNRWLLTCAFVTTIVLFYLSYAVIDDSDLDFDDNGSNHRDLTAQCRESCSDVILSRDEVGSATSPGSLAFSAVDALFSFREGDDETQIPTTRKGQKRQQQGQGKNNAMFIESDIYSNLSSRPNRLPSLIETLVGTIDGNHDFEILPQRDGKGGTRKVRNDRIHSPYGNQVEISTRSSDDSVAMVAAAAAAALWSESETRRGRLRMKTFNDEWESSLRWIASWGQQQHGNTGTTDQPINTGRSRKSHNADRGSTRKKRRKGTALGKEMNSEYSDFSELLDSCVAQCTGGTGDEQVLESRPGHVDATEIRSDNVRAMISALKLISSPFVYSSEYFRSLQANMKFIRSLFGMAISSALMLFVRNVTDWWKHKTSLRSLLEEETHEEKLDNFRNKKNKARASGKKSTSKKTRRKRKDLNREQKSISPFLNTNVSICEDGDEDASIESDSSEEITFFVGGNQNKQQKLDNCFDDGSIDHCSKDHASSSSTSSYITCDLDPEFCLIRAGPKSTHNTPGMHFLKQRKFERRKTQGHSPKLASSRSKAQSPSNRKLQPEIKPHMPDFSLTEGATVETGSLTKCDQDTASIMTAESPCVPTEEQREEASRLLREFQSSQIDKIIKSQLHSVTTAPSDKTPPRAVGHTNVSKDSDILHQKPSDLTQSGLWMDEYFKPFSPKVNTTICVNDANQLSLSTGTDEFGQSILNMLEESVDEFENRRIPEKEKTEFSSVPYDRLLNPPLSNDRKLTKDRTEIRSIALGGLLTSKNNTASSVSSNPWCNEKSDSSRDGQPTNILLSNPRPTRSFEDSPRNSQELDNHISEYKDPNICLQVSAREYLPSWDSSQNRGNHAQAW